MADEGSRGAHGRLWLLFAVRMEALTFLCNEIQCLAFSGMLRKESY